MKKNNLIALILAIAIVAVGIIYATRDMKKSPSDTPPVVTETRDVTLYYYNPERDTDAEGNIQCTSAGLVGVTRTIPKTRTPGEDTIALLLKGELSAEERTAGLTTEFPLAGLALTDSSLEDGTLTLLFSDPANSTSGGSCRIGILRSQIERTALQFEGVTDVEIQPETLFQP